MYRLHLSWRHLFISQLLVTRFWLNFKCRFLGPCLRDANCHGEIWSGNICPGNICPYQPNISCYWPDFDQPFGTQFLWNNIFLNKTSFDPNIFWTKHFCVPSFFLFFTQTFLGPTKILYQKVFHLNSLWTNTTTITITTTTTLMGFDTIEINLVMDNVAERY